MRPVVLLLALLALAPAAAARTESGTGTVAPGVPFEMDLFADVRNEIAWEWSARDGESEVAFNVHTHDGGRVVTVREVTAAESRGSVVLGPGPFSLMWSHLGEGAPEVPVAWSLTGQYRRLSEPAGTGVDAPEEPQESPIAWPLVAGAVAAACALARRR